MSNVVETVTIRYQQEGGAELKRMAESLARAQETVAKFTKDQTSAGSASSLQLGAWGKSYQNFQARVEGVSKATRQAYSDLRALTQGMKAGVGDQAEFARGLERIKQNLTAMGTATGRDFGMAADISKRMNIGAVGTDAREAAKVFEASFAKIEAESKATAEAIRRNFGEAFNIRMNIGSSARELGATTSALEKLSEKLDLIEGGRSARVGQGINERLGINSATAQQLGATTSALADLARQLDVVDAARTANFGEQLNARFNIGGPGAKDMGGTVSALMESEKAAQKFEQRLERIIAEIDPVTTAQKRYNTELAEYQALADKGYLSSTQLGQAQQVAAQRFEYTSRALEGVGSATKLGVQDMQNLQFQLNDIAVSLASGQSPFTVLMQQGAQMTQVFGPGASVGGALKSVGGAIKEFVLNPLNLAVLGFAAAAGAVALIYNAVQSKFPPIEDRIERQTKAVEELAKRYNMAAVAATGYADKSASRLAAVSEADFAKDLAAYKARADKMAAYIRGVALTAVPQTDMLGSFFGGAEMKFPQIADLMAGFNKSDPQAVQRLLDGLAELSRASTDPAFKEFARQIEADYAAVAELGARLKGTNEILDATSKRITALAAEFKTAMGVLTGMGPAATTEMQRLDAAFARAADSAQSLGEIDAAAKAYQRALDDMNRDSANTVREMQGQFDDLSIAPSGREIAEIKRRYDQEIADSARLQGSTTIRQNLEKARDLEILAVKEQLRREDTARREGFELDMRAITARTAAEKAGIEAERVRIGLRAEGEDPGVIEQRAAEAAALSRAQSEHALAEALRSRNLAEQEALGSIQLEIDSLGKSAGASAEAAERFRLLAQYKEAAYQEGRDSLTAAETARIEEQAKAVGALNQALAEQTLKQEILDERKMIGLSDKEREVQERLQAAGIDATSANGEYLASQLRVNDALQESADRARDFVETLVDGLTSGKGLLDSLAGAFGGFAKSLAAASLDKLVGGLLGAQGGGSASSASSAGGLAGALSAVAGGLSKIATPTATTTFSQTQSFGAPVSGGSSGALQAMAQAMPAAAAASSGAMLKYASRFNSGVDNRLMTIMKEATKRFDMPVTAVSGLRPGDKRFHGQGIAADVSIAGLGNYQDASTFRTYEKFAQLSKQVQSELFPELEGMLRWGGYFSGGKGKYGALDNMHFDLGGKRVGMAGGSWESGLTAAQRRLFPGAESVGMGGKSGSSVTATSNAFQAQAVSAGVADYAKKSATGSVPSLLGDIMPSSQAQAAMAGGFDGFSHNGGAAAGITKGLTGLQAGMSALSAGIGVAVNAYQSGDPLGGAVSGALSGYSLGASIGAIGGPLGALAGAAIGGIAGLFGKSKKKKEEAKAKKAAEDQKALEASKAWVANLPQFASLIDTVTRTQRGSIGSTMKELNAGIDQFAQLAAETKNSVAMSQVEGVRKQIAEYGDLLKSLFRDSMQPMVEDMAAGYGTDTAFTKARDGVIKTADAYRGFIDDVRMAFSYDTAKIDSLKAEHDASVQAIEAAKASQMAAMAADYAKSNASSRGLNRNGDPVPVMGITRESQNAATFTQEQEADYAKQIEEAAIKRDEEIAAYEAEIADVKSRYDTAVHNAVMAAREGLLRLVSGDVQEQSAVEQALAEARGAAQGLDLALRDLGMSATEATAAIDEAMGKRRDMLRKDFETELSTKIEDLDGKGYLAQFRDLTKSVEGLMKDANLLGADSSLVDTFFTKQAQALVDSSELTGDAFAELIELFPNLTDRVKAFAEAAEEVGRSLAEVMARAQSYSDRYFAATNNPNTLAGATAAFDRNAAAELKAEYDAGSGAMTQLQAAQAAERVVMLQGLLNRAREEEVAQLENTVSQVENFRNSVRDLRKSLLLDDNLSPLSQEEQFLEAQRQFRDVSARAAAGDEEAQQKLAGISQSYLEEAKNYYASSEDYYRAFNEVQGVLTSAESLAEQQLATIKAQLDVQKAQLEATNGVKDGLAALGAALAAAQAAAAAAAVKAGATTPTGAGGGGGGAGGTLFVPQNELQSFLGAQYEAILGRAPDAAGLSYYQGIRDTGATAEDIINMIRNSPEAKGYALGGFTGFGGSNEIAGTVHRNEVVWSQPDIARWGGVANVEGMRVSSLPRVPGMAAPRVGANSNAALAEEVRRLGAKLDRLTAVTAEGDMLNAAATREGNAAQQSLASSAKRQAAA